ncbi:DHHA1 domain-containing protein, partial [Mesonia mobilis]
FSKVSAEELKQVENFVNARIRENLPLEENRKIAYAEAIEQGAIALFGEKYGDAVRTIRFGDSMELCGGTHVKNTSEIWHFKIISEGAVASGVRRIEAITGDAAKDFLTQQSENFNQIKALFKNAKDPIKAVNDLQDENSALKKEIETLLKEKAKNVKGDLKNELTEINGVQFLAKQVDLDGGALKDLSFQLGGEVENLFLLLGSANNGKAIISCYISKDLAEEKGLNAGQIVRELGKYIQGGGGGQAFFATAGGKNLDGIAKALEEGKKFVS